MSETRFGLKYDDLWKRAPDAAAAIFAYQREMLGESSWRFDGGGITDDRKFAHAVFSRVSVTGYGREQLTIHAKLNGDKWIVTHQREPEGET